MKGYVAPQFELDGFNCPHCEAYSQQMIHNIFIEKLIRDDFQNGLQYQYRQIVGLNIYFCAKCKKYSLWQYDEFSNAIMIYPLSSNAPLPEDDMPQDVKEDFEEARQIMNISPRGAAALLRLAIQKLMVHLGENNDNLNTAIGNLVKKGLGEEIKEALDTVRVIGNEAVHPAQLDLKDDPNTAIMLFDLLNWIIDVMITQPKKRKDMHNKLSDSKKEQISKRDSKNKS